MPEGVPQTGLILDVPKPSLWILGAETGIEYAVDLESGDWRDFVPSPEEQAHMFVFDTKGCTNFSYTNVVETRLNWLIKTGKMSAAGLTFLKQNGYIDQNGSVNFSDKHLYIRSGTTINGNNLQTVCEKASAVGLIPEKMLPSNINATATLAAWAAPGQITPVMDALAAEFLKHFEMPFQMVFFDDQVGWSDVARDAVVKALKQSPLQFAIPRPAYHAIENTYAKPPTDYGLFDSYDPYTEVKTWNKEVHYAFQIVAREKVGMLPPPVPTPPVTPPSTPDAPDLEIQWIGSPNFGPRGAYKPEAIVLHIIEGSLGQGNEPTLGSADSWFNNPASEVSAHYSVGREGEIHQYVKETDRAFHAGVVSDPQWKLLKPVNVVNPNAYTIGIEHEGFFGQAWTEKQKASSALLVKSICKRWGIPIDRDHIIGHYQIRSTKPNCPAADKSIIDEIVKRAGGSSFHHVFNVDLKFGSAAGPELHKLQEALQYLHSKSGKPYMAAGVFGPYGPQTKTAVKLFQDEHGITNDDGSNFGPRTRAQMNALTA